MKNIKGQRTLSLRTHTIRDLTAEDLRLAVGGRSGGGHGAGSGSGHGAGSGGVGTGHHVSGSLAASQSGGYGGGGAHSQFASN